MNVNELVDRPAVRLFEDGITELVFGLLALFYIAALYALLLLPRNWSDVAGFSGPVLLAGLGLGVFWLLPRLRQTIVFPRIGYVALQPGSRRTTRWRVLMWTFFALGWFFWSVPVIPDIPHKTAVILCVLFSASQIYSGIRYHLPYQILIGVLWIPFTIWVFIAHASIEITAFSFGAVMAVTGAIKLWRFVATHPVLTEGDA